MFEEFSKKLAALFGNGTTPGQFGGDISPTGMTYPTAENTGANWSPIAGTNGSGLGFNLGTLGVGVNGLAALGGLLQGQKAFGLAKDQFNFAKSTTNTNLNNSIKSYNTALEDRLRSRGVAEGTDSATVEANIQRNRLSR